MRNLGKLLFSRVVLVTLAILLQIVVLVAGVTRLQSYYRWLNAGLSLLSWAVVLLVISGRSNPSYKIAWSLLIAAFPVAGILIYLMFGGTRISGRERRRMGRLGLEADLHLPQRQAVLDALAETDPDSYHHARYLKNASSYPIYDDSAACYYSSGEAVYAEIMKELEKAQRYIFLEYFILDRGVMWDSILSILERKAQAGLDVRVLYDDFGSIRRLPGNYAKRLRKLGLRAHAVNPYVPIVSGRLNNRDHRKLLLIDGKVGFTGGVNLADEYINVPGSPNLGHWKDCGLRVEGRAVWSMTVMFLSMWDYVDRTEEDLAAFRPQYPDKAPGAEGWIQPFADSPLDNEEVGANIFLGLIGSARKRLWLMSPYLILDDRLRSALCVAAKTGVDVRIVTPGNPDKWYVHAVTRANYELLTQAGVRIYEYSPGFLHSKVCLCDDQRAVVGTVNLDFRSLYLHFENAVYLCHCPAVVQVEQDFDRLFPQCREITYALCRHVHLWQRVGRSILRIFAPLM